MKVISCSRMSNQSRILLEDHSTGRVCVFVCVCGRKRRKISEIHAEREKNEIPNYPSCLAKPAGQQHKHSVHLRPLKASHTSKTFTKYPLTTHSLLFVSVVLFISLHSSRLSHSWQVKVALVILYIFLLVQNQPNLACIYMF